MKLTTSTLFILLLFIQSFNVLADQAPIIGYAERFQPAIAKNGMVASQEIVASQVGRDILKKGGNAIDAAVATGFALAVTLPRAGNLGGGGFMVIHLADENKTVAIDYRESAPAAAHPDIYLDENGNVLKDLATHSHQSAGVPGTVAGLSYVLSKYGTMSLKQVMAPAIKLARKGVTVSYSQSHAINNRKKVLQSNPASREKFYKKDGSAYQIGETWKQKDLAWSLKQIARHGPDAFYKGVIAKKIVADMQNNNGLITSEDLANYQVKEREPIIGNYRGYTIATMPPPSSGGVHLVQMLNVLEGFDLKQKKQNSAATIHLLAETMKYAYSDRSKYLGDPDFYPVPVSKLTDKKYADSIRKHINNNTARPSREIRPGKHLPDESPNTTHFSVADNKGNVVSNTYTLNYSFGSGITVPGTGILLNNEMDDFSAKAGVANGYGLIGGKANAIEANKRPLSSMTPTIVFKDNKPWLITGSPGGSRIINSVLQVILNSIDFDLNIASSTALPRVHHQWLPDKLTVETGISSDTLRLLKNKGHTVEIRNRTFGSAQSILIGEDYFYGASDTRRPGAGVAGY